MLNGIHLYALLESPDLIEADIPEQLRPDWQGLVQEYRDMNAEAREAERDEIMDRIHERVHGEG